MNKQYKTHYSKIKKRNIPASIFFKALFKSFSSRNGLIFFIVSSLFLIPFRVSINDTKFTDDSPLVDGKITEVVKTNGSKGDVSIYKYKYSYIVAGKKYKGKSYKLGKEEPEVVHIEYLPEKPQISRIKGMTIGIFPFKAMAVIYILQIISLLFFIIGIIIDIKFIKFLRYGIITKATYFLTGETKDFSGITYHKMRFTYTSEEQRTYESFGYYYTNKKMQKKIIYNPKNLKQYITFDSNMPNFFKEFFKDYIKKNRN